MEIVAASNAVVSCRSASAATCEDGAWPLECLELRIWRCRYPFSMLKTSSSDGEWLLRVSSAYLCGQGHRSPQGPCAYATIGMEESEGDNIIDFDLGGTSRVPNLELRGENFGMTLWLYLAMAASFASLP
jgi:hypothetical protein